MKADKLIIQGWTWTQSKTESLQLRFNYKDNQYLLFTE